MTDAIRGANAAPLPEALVGCDVRTLASLEPADSVVATSPPAPAPDTLAAMYGALVRLRDTEVTLAKLGVAENAQERKKALADLQDALRRAAANESDAGSGFFASLGKIVDDVVGDVLQGRFADAWSDFGGDAGAAIDSPKFWSDLENGFRDIALVSNGVAEAAEQVGGQGGAAVAAAASTVGSWATAGAALCHARGEGFQAEAQDARADATGLQGSIDALTRSAALLTDDARDDVESNARALRSVDRAIQIRQKTLLDSLSPSLRG